MAQTTMSGDASNAPEASTYSAYITEELCRYDEHLRDVRGLAASTRKQRLRIIGWLLEGKFKHRAIVFAQMRPDDVRQFLARRLAKQQSAAYASHHATALRSYLRYRATCGDPVGKLAAIITNPVHWRLATLPKALNVEEADRLLDSAAEARKTPKRAYAIVRLALDLGLRSGEIANLNLDDVDWQAGTLILRGTKSQRQDVVPLPEQTGKALADYVEHERSAIRHPAIFVRQIAGRTTPITSCAVQKVIKCACRRIGLLTKGSAMENRMAMKFRVRDKGGPSGGKTLSGEYPDFDFALFMKTPNVDAFIRKHYLATVKKIIREIDEGKNGTQAGDLNSFETIVARSLSFTKEEISDWMRTRDWQRATEVKDMAKLLPELEKYLPAMANRTHPFLEEKANELADKVIAKVADNPDPVADFLFTTLTTRKDDALPELFPL